MNIEEADPASAIRSARNAIAHVHFADTNRRAVGFGHLQVAPLIHALRDIDYQGYLSAEVFAWPDSSSAAKQTMDAYKKWVPN
jgi:sugar phosphate isomerase/epimerase